MCQKSFDIIDVWVKRSHDYYINNKSESDKSNTNGAIYSMFNGITDSKNDKFCYGFRQITDDISSLFMVGTDGTKTQTIKVLKTLCYVDELENINLQDLIYEEIVSTCSNDSDDNHDINVSKLPLLRALIHESLRINLSKRLIFCFPRFVINNECKINEYNIPKGSISIPNYASFLRDKNYWKGNAQKFDINNWLKQVGNNSNNDNKEETTYRYQFIYNNSYAAFGFGKRNCPGNALAIRMMIIKVAYLLKRYKFAIGNKNKNAVKAFSDVQLTVVKR